MEFQKLKRLMQPSSLSEPIANLPLSDEEKAQVFEFETSLGNGDGRIDVFELKQLEEGSAHLFSISYDTLALINKTFLFKNKAQRISTQSNTVTLERNDGGRKIFYFDPFSRLTEISTIVQGQWEQSLIYSYTDPTESAMVEVEYVDTEAGTMADEIFLSSMEPPFSFEEFALVASGALDEVSLPERSNWIFKLRFGEGAFDELLQAAKVSHPQLVSRLFHWLLLPQKKASPEDQFKAIEVADRLWQALIADHSTRNLDRAVRILRGIPSLSSQALLLTHDYLFEANRFQQIVSKMPDPEGRNVEHLLRTLQIHPMSSLQRPNAYLSLRVNKSLVEAAALLNSANDPEWEARGREEEKNNRKILENRFDGMDVRVDCVFTGAKILRTMMEEKYLPLIQKEGPWILTSYLKKTFYQEALFFLSRRNPRLWQGNFSTQDLEHLAALSSALVINDTGVLQGEWAAWYYEDRVAKRQEVDPLRLKIEARQAELLRQDYVLESFGMENIFMVSAFHPASLLKTEHHRADSLITSPVLDTTVMAYDKEEQMFYEFTADQQGHITAYMEINGVSAVISGTLFIDILGSCYVESREETQGLMKVRWPDGREEDVLINKNYDINWIKERLKDWKGR